MTSWLKAGLIGALILIVLNLIGLVPVLGCITGILGLVAYVGAGVMAAAWTPPPRTAGKGAGQGALAALIAGLGGGIVSLVIGVVRAAGGGAAQAISQIPPQALQQLQDAGIPADFLLGGVGATIIGSVCCLTGVVIAAALGAIGGAIYAATKPNS